MPETNFVSVFLHSYLTACNVPQIKGIFHTFDTVASTKLFSLMTNITNDIYLNLSTFQLII